jgi:prepilin-type N-terminal cleavage/methylation domain-containing protein/prepilin-type processing-associated H-X9-DG protein
MQNIRDTRLMFDVRGNKERVNHPSSFAFTLTELLVVIALIAILTAILLPVLNAAQGGASIVQCLNNHKQLITAWVMYARENQDVLCPNAALSGGNGSGQADTIGTSWVAGYEHLDANLEDNTNILYLQNSLLAPYSNRSTKIYKCPDDAFLCTEGGVLMPRVRSVSMNVCIEGNYYIASGGNASLGIPNNEAYYPAIQNLKYYCYVKLTDMGGIPGPGPADLWVMGDEHGNTINNGNMSWFSSGSQWADTPASYHDLGNNYSFADGHVGYHKWTTGWNSSGGTSGTGLAGWPQLSAPGGLAGGPNLGNRADFNWVTAHGTTPHP